MDKDLIKRVCSLGEEKKLPEKSPTSMPTIVHDELLRWKPSEFLTRHNPDVGLAVIRRGLTSGELALDGRIPTLAQVAEVYGEATATAWLKVQLDSIDAVQGANAFGETARQDAVKLIYARYKDVNVANLLQFFARYRLNEYYEQVAHIGGIQKLLTALRLYIITRDDDARRIARNRDIERAWQQRQEWERKAISYDEYVKTKEV